MKLSKMFALMAILAPVVGLSPDALAQESSRSQELREFKADLDEQTALGIQLQQDTQAMLRQHRAEQARLFLEENQRNLDEMREQMTVKQDNTRVALPIRRIDLLIPEPIIESDIQRSLALDNDVENAETLNQVQENLTGEAEVDTRTLEEIALDVANGIPVGQTTSVVLTDTLESESESELEIAEEIEEVAETSSEILDQAEESELSDGQVAEISTAIEQTEEVVEVLEDELENNEEVTETEESQLNNELAEARAELAEAREALASRETEVEELQAEREALTNAYCEQKSSLTDLTARVEEFENSTFGQLNERLDMLSQLMVMNIMGQNGPQFNFDRGLNRYSDFYRMQGMQNGLDLMSLNDFFQARSLGFASPASNIYNITGDYYAGNYSSNPVSGDYYGSFQSTMGQRQAGLNFPSVNAPAFSYNFGNSSGGVQDSSRFSAHHTPMDRSMIENQVSRMNEGAVLYQRTPSTSGETAPAETSGNASNMLE